MLLRMKYLWAKICKKLRGTAIRGSVIDKTSKIEAGSQVVDSSMQKYSYCGYDCSIVYAEIGAFVSIADNVTIGGARHPYEWVSMSPVFYEGRDSVKRKFATHKRPQDKQVRIGADVWIGKGAFIAQGICLGVGCVVGMNAVVTKDVPPYSIVAGNPARVIKMRFDKESISRLIESKWWEWDDSKIYKYATTFNKVDDFLAMLNK